MRVMALASGSSGNAFLVEADGTAILLDAGLPAPLLERYLLARGVHPSELAAIFLSHEHTDHLRGAGVLARRHHIPVVATAGTLRAGADDLGALPDTDILRPGGELVLRTLVIRTFPVSHDAREPVGFWVAAGGHHVCICTDLGIPTPAIIAPLWAADLLVLEANHDRDRLWRGPYPPALKRRVAGPHGHLANEEAARLVADLAAGGRTPAIWLAHLSATNNTPTLAYTTVTSLLRLEGLPPATLAVAARDRPSLIWDSKAVAAVPRQLALPF